MYCKEQITMSDESGKWLPYNEDGSSHDCRTKTKQQEEPPAKEKRQQQQEKPSEVTIHELLDRLAAVGVIIDMKSIMANGKGKDKGDNANGSK